MKKATPNYYSRFKCIADKCKHSCCIGWEITVDKDTLKYYNTVVGELGKRLSHCISADGIFILDGNKRCPFLNTSGLCDIITGLGENALCTICTEHPRFYNFYLEFCEVGLGMCCEHAAKIILESKEKFCLTIPDDVGVTTEERYFFLRRQAVFDILQNRSIGILQRVENLCNQYGFELSDMSFKEVVTLLSSLERLDDSWTSCLKKLQDFEFDMSIFEQEELWTPFEQLLCYLAYRHFDMEKGNYYEIVCFICVGFLVVGALCTLHKNEFDRLETEDISEYARLFSSEVEYSTENTEKIIEYFE